MKCATAEGCTRLRGDDLCVEMLVATPTCFESTDTSKMWSRIFEVKVLDGIHLGNRVAVFTS